MAYARGKYGITYTPRPERSEPHGLGRLLVGLLVLAAVFLVWSLVARFRARDSAVADEGVSSRVAAEVVETAGPVVQAVNAALQGETARGDLPMPASTPSATVPDADLIRRPAPVRLLLMRLDEANRAKDVDMAISTIEQIRALPGSPAADLDDALARRLGRLNMRRLFTLKYAKWVATVTVRRGDTSARIAAEHGSTRASFDRLNGSAGAPTGATVSVLNHPRFNLVVRRRMRIADLSLNGKFFKRYDLAAEARAKTGVYARTSAARDFLQKLGLTFTAADRDELDMLLPIGAGITVTEM